MSVPYPAYPPGCPPADAVAPAGKFYRLNPFPTLNEQFLLSQYEKDIDRPFGEADCKARALSLAATLDDAVRLRSRIKAMRSWPLVEVTLDGAPGLLKHTPSSMQSSHHSWWIPCMDRTSLIPRLRQLETEASAP
jgi:hypothetical protein